MATRKIIDAKHNGEKVWLKGHAQATFMSDGSTVEDKITSLESSGTDLTGYVKQEDLAAVATSGSYNDLSNKPTIPSAVTESTVSGWGFTKNAGTVTGVNANGTAITLSRGVANIPAASTSAYGVTKLSSATNSTSTSLAATASAVKAAYDLANSYKGTVTSVKINGTTKNPTSGVVDLGTVITAHQTLKTINGQSILGSGDIVITGGGIQAVATGDVVDDVNVNYATKTYVDGLVGDINSTLGDINSVLESIINGGVSLITFTIAGTEYHAENGMTWEQWVNSEYNTANYMLAQTLVWANASQYVLNNGASASPVAYSDIILNNSVYKLGSGND